MKYNYDVVIIGAGIAGLSVASFLSSKKIKVGLLELKNNPLKLTFFTLGSFLDFKKYHLPEKVVASYIKKCVFHTKYISLKKRGWAKIIDKKEVHGQFYKSCLENKVYIKPSTEIVNFLLDGEKKIQKVIDKKGNEYLGKVFIDCSGQSAILTKKLNLQDLNPKIGSGIEYNCKYKGNKEECHFFYGKNFQGGYGWIFPIKKRRAIVGFCTFDPKIIFGLKNRFDTLLKNPLLSLLIEKDNNKVYGGTFPITNVKTKLVSKNILAVGDSVTQYNPVVGEGYRFIIDSASMAAEAVEKFLKTSNLEDLKIYQTKWNQKYKDTYKQAKTLQKLADWGSKNDILASLLALFLKTKRSKTFENLMAGNVKRRYKYFP